jgi:hypothetical protein
VTRQKRKNTMNTTKRFADKLFALGFRVAFQFFRRSPVKAAEPAPAGTQSWLASPASGLSWEDALSAQRQQAERPLN